MIRVNDSEDDAAVLVEEDDADGIAGAMMDTHAGAAAVGVPFAASGLAAVGDASLTRRRRVSDASPTRQCAAYVSLTRRQRVNTALGMARLTALALPIAQFFTV